MVYTIISIFNYFKALEYPSYKGIPIVPVQSRRGGKQVSDEMIRNNIDLHDVEFILTNGYKIKRRRTEVLEKAYDVGTKTVKVVVQKKLLFEEYVWELIHVGTYTKRK